MTTPSGPGGGRPDPVLDAIMSERRQLINLTYRLLGSLAEAAVNGRPGLVAQQDGVIVTVFAFEVAGDRIKHIWVVRNPDKLRPWTTG
jgi:RNA polymerase sigma-70 factor, ECF subfamily